ncbi:MAG: DUF1343 domain-containing protein [Candidatus Schekmanbacteria bacterium]|nr:DUF1343 domain-containing protein [Candidatus Schekmanbacteria bacterium]
MIKTGLERLVDKDFAPLRGLRVGLVVNQTAVDSRLRHLVEHLWARTDVHLRALLSPEHGLWGDAQDQVSVGSIRDSLTGLTVHSLYGATPEDLAPDADILRDLDILVFDIQDVGSRYYTFVWTLAHCMEAAARVGTAVLVLDRPNPIGGAVVQGNIQDDKYLSFVGRFPVAVRHGLTVGEIARLLQGEFGIACELSVLALEGWRRDDWFEATGLPWVSPSPNMPAVETAAVYPGMCLLEGTNLSEGRGTTRPFEILGAPFIDPHRLALELNGAGVPGVRFRPLFFRPTFGKYAGHCCGGAQLHVVDRSRLDPFVAGLAVVVAVQRLWPDAFCFADPPYEFELERLPFDLLAGTPAVREAILAGVDHHELAASFQGDIERFREQRAPYLLYRE